MKGPSRRRGNDLVVQDRACGPVASMKGPSRRRGNTPISGLSVGIGSPQ
mgnify:CR=1 FL=1